MGAVGRNMDLQQVELMPWRNGLLNEMLLTIPIEGTWDETLPRIEAKLQEMKSALSGRGGQLTLHLGTRSLSGEEMEALANRLKQGFG